MERKKIVDHITDNERKKQLGAVLLSYNLMATVHFLTRVQNESNVVIGYIFRDNYKFMKYTVSPIYKVRQANFLLN
jgi:hypothetical protein